MDKLGEALEGIEAPAHESLFFPSQDSVNRLCRYLESAFRTIDICMYMFTYLPYAERLALAANKNHVKVRLILEDIGKDDEGAPVAICKHKIISRLKSAPSIEIKYHKETTTKRLLHHKFCLIDEEILMTGSYNWTTNASENNHENLMIIKGDYQNIDKYKTQFELLWEDPNRSTEFMASALNQIEGSSTKAEMRTQADSGQDVPHSDEKVEHGECDVKNTIDLGPSQNQDILLIDELELSSEAHLSIPHTEHLGKRNRDQLGQETLVYQKTSKKHFKTPEVRTGSSEFIELTEAELITPPAKDYINCRKKRKALRKKSTCMPTDPLLIKRLDDIYKEVVKTKSSKSQATDTADLIADKLATSHNSSSFLRSLFSRFCSSKIKNK